MKRFAVLPLLLFVFACGDTTTEPAMDDTLPTVAAFEANPDSEGAVFLIDEDGEPGLALGFWSGGIGCYAAINNPARIRHQKSADQYQMKVKDNLIFLMTPDLTRYYGEGNSNIYALQDPALFPLENLDDLLLHYVWDLTVDGVDYHVVCHYRFEDGEETEAYIDISLK